MSCTNIAFQLFNLAAHTGNAAPSFRQPCTECIPSLTAGHAHAKTRAYIEAPNTVSPSSLVCEVHLTKPIATPGHKKETECLLLFLCDALDFPTRLVQYL